MKLVCQNRRARRMYEILETLEAGLVLCGTEVKSLREGRANISDAYADVVEGELFLLNLHISPYRAASHFGHEPTRRRKLLVHRRELERLGVKVQERGLTLIPLRIYFEGSWAKVELGLARGKKMYDRRRDMAERESRREVARAVKRHQDRGKSLPLLALLGFLAVCPITGTSRGMAGAEEVSVSPGGDLAPELVEARRSEGGLYFSVNSLGRWWGAVKEWDPTSLSLRLRVEGHEARLLADNPWVTVDDRLINLPVPVRVWEGVVWVPLEFVRQAAPVLAGLEARWDPARSTLAFVPPGTNVLALEMRTALNGVLEIEITLAEPLEFALDATRPGEIMLRIEGGVLDEEAAGGWHPLLPVRRLGVNQGEGFAEILFGLAAEGGTATAVPAEEGRVIIMRLASFIPVEAPPPELAGLRPLPPEIAGLREEAAPPLLVIDPGHGGAERGAVGPSGFLEKKANLEIARHLKRILEEEGEFRVMLTREEDQRVPLLRRAEMGNLFGAEAFVSIHCNGWPGPGARGFEIYHLRSVRTAGEGAEGGTGREAADTSRLVRQGDLEIILWDLAQEAHLEDSRRLAAFLREELSRLGLPDRGVKHGSFTVLEGIHAPAVLVETAFITNPVEEGLLRTDSFRRRLARALASALKRFATSREVP